MIEYTNHLEEEKEDDYIYVFEGNVWLGGKVIQCDYRAHVRAKNENEAWGLFVQKYCDETKLKTTPVLQGKIRKKRYFDGNLR